MMYRGKLYKFLVLFLFAFLLPLLPVRSSRAQLPEDEMADEEEDGAGESLDREELYDLLIQPIDLNVCSEGDLLIFPWISRKTASEIIKYRNKIKGFWRTDELLKVKGVTQEIFEQISPYVTVTAEKKIKESPFHGDTRTRIRIEEPREDDYIEADGKWQHPLYLYNRTRFRYGHKYEAGWVARRDDEGLMLTPENIQKYFLVKNYLLMRNVYGFNKVIAGNYTLHFNQGLLFYYPFNELIRPVKGKPRGLREDKTTGMNAHLRGIAAEKESGPVQYTLFYSDKPLMADVEEDGTVSDSIISLRDDYGYIDLDNDDNLDRHQRLREKLYGGKFTLNFAENSNVSMTAFQDKFSREINPSGLNQFRGKENNLLGAYLDTWYKSMNLVAEFAQSGGKTRRSGNAWLVQPNFHFSRLFLCTAIYDYDADYLNQYASGIGMNRDYTYNEQGFMPFLEYKGKKTNVKVYSTIARHPEPAGSHLPWNESDVYFHLSQKLSKRVEFYFREWDGWDETYYEGRYTGRGWQKTRLQLTWEPSQKTRLRARWDQRRERLYDYDTLKYGHLLFGDVKYKPTDALSWNFRIIYFDAAEVYMSALEFLWPQVLIPQYWGAAAGSGEGIKLSIAPTLRLSEFSQIWIKYENIYYLTTAKEDRPESKSDVDTLIRSTRHTFRVQYDVKW